MSTLALLSSPFFQKLGQLSVRLGQKIAIRPTDLIELFDNLAALLFAGISLVGALEVLKDENNNQPLSRMISKILEQVQSGRPISQCLADYGHVFPPMVVTMVEIGEVSGNLATVCEEIAAERRREYELSSRVKGAMIYPIIVLGGMVGVGVALIVVVVPQISAFLADFDAELPAITKALIWLSDNIRIYANWIIVGLLILSLILYEYARTARGKVTVGQFVLMLPIFGPMQRYLLLNRFARSLSSLLRGGVPILHGLELLPLTTGNHYYQQAIRGIGTGVERGLQLHEAMHDFPKHFPAMMTKMIRVSEETGTLDKSLDKLAGYYERRVDNIVRNISQMLEPILMLAIGLGVGVMALAVIAPIYSIATSIN